MEEVKREATFLTTRWKRQSANTVSAERSLLWHVIVRCVIVLGAQIFQVYFIRAMFKNKGFIGIVTEMKVTRGPAAVDLSIP